MKKRVIIELIPALLILLFAYTAFSKLIDYRRFTIVLEQFPFLKSVSHLMGWLLPVSELLVVVLLFFLATRFIGLLASLVMMVIFTGFLSYMIVFYPKLPCNCGGVISSLSWNQHIWFNLFFLCISLWSVINYHSAKMVKYTAPP